MPRGPFGNSDIAHRGNEFVKGEGPSYTGRARDTCLEPYPAIRRSPMRKLSERPKGDTPRRYHALGLTYHSLSLGGRRRRLRAPRRAL